MEKIEITTDILKQAGFKEITNNYDRDFWNKNGVDNYSEWWKRADSIDGNNFIIINCKKGVTNNNAAWGIHVDNCDDDSIGSADITYTWQFNMLMEILESKFRL